MSLMVYIKEKDVPKGMKIITNNDDFFSLYTSLNNSDFEKIVLNVVEKARYLSSETFISREDWMGGLYRDYLSTGCKTLLNIEKNPNYCFSTIECGQNVLSMLRLLRNGNVLLNNRCIRCWDSDHECDIVYNGMHFMDFSEFRHYIMVLEPSKEV